MKILFIVFLFFGIIYASCPTGGTQLTNSNLDVTIASGQTFYITGDLTLNSITVAGTLYIKNEPTNLTLKWLKVLSGGKLYIGERSCPITNKVTVTLVGPRDNTGNDMGTDVADGVALGSKGIAVTTGAFVEIYGDYSKTPFTNLKQYANKGDTIVYVATGTKWVVGDTILFVETDFPAVPYTYTSDYDQNEVKTIQSITANVACPNSKTDKCDQITISTPLKYVHYCNANEYCGEVAQLNRNIIIQGDSNSTSSLFGGHLMIRKVTGGAIVGAEFTRMGQRGVVGRYPIHFHQLYQTDGVSVFARYNSIHDNFQRCLVIHDSNSITVERNVAFNANCSCYFLEDGSEINNVFNYNLGAKVLNINAGDLQIIPSDTQASVFWITNPLNNFTGNVASGGTFGFWYVMPEKPNGKSQAKYANDPNMAPRRMPLGRFDNNIAHSNRDSGVMIDQMQNPDGTIQIVANPSWTPQLGPYNSTANGLAVPGYLFDLLAYKNRNFGYWFRASNLWFTRFKSYDNRIGFQAVVMPATIQNSIFICETNNTGYFINPGWNGFVVTPRARANIWSEKAPLYGYQNYDASGPQFQSNNTFGGCFSNQYRNSSIISSLENAHNILFPQNRYLRTKILDGSQRFYFQRYPNAFNTYPYELDSPKFVYVHDVDGTITNNMGTWLVPQESYHTYGLSGCTFNVSENCQRCPPFYEGFGYLNIENTNIAATDFAGTNLNATNPWIRSTWYYFGDTSKVNGISTAGEAPTDPTRTEYRVNFVSRRGVMVTFPHATPPSLNLMYTAAAPGDWVIVGIPYPAGTITVARNTYPQNTFTKVNSLAELVADTYYYANNLLYVRLENGLPQSSTSFNYSGGFVYQSSWNNQVSIKHSCSGSSCSATAAVPAALPTYETLFKADLCPATGKSNTYGVAFFGFDIRTKMLSYQIYHGKGPQTTSLTLGGIDLGIPYSPAEGVFYPSYTQYQNIYSGKWKVQVNELSGTVGCDTTRNSACTAPPAISTQQACLAQDNFVVISSDSLNKITGNKLASWSSWSYSATISNSTDKLCGTGSLLLNTKNGALSAHNDNNGIVVPSNYFFQFWVKAVIPSKVELQIQITAANASTANSVRVLSKYINHWAVTNELFTRVKIPLADFGFTADTSVARIDFLFYQSWNLVANQTVLITDARFVSPTVADPTGTPNAVSQNNYKSTSCYVDPGVLLRDESFSTTTSSASTFNFFTTLVLSSLFSIVFLLF